MKIYTYKVNNLINNQKQLIIDAILKKYPCHNQNKQKELIDFLKDVFDYFVEINEDLFVAYENNRIVGFAFVCINNDIKKDTDVLKKIEKAFELTSRDQFLYQYLERFYDELNIISPLVTNTNFNQHCIVTLCQFLDPLDNLVGLEWFTRTLLNYYLLQNKTNICFYKLNQEFINFLLNYCQIHNIEYSINEYGLEVRLKEVLIDKFDYINFTQKNIVEGLTYKFSRLNSRDMWTKKYISPVHPENNIIMIHGVNSYGYTFIDLVPFLLNYGNVILLDLPLHRDSKEHSFLNTEWGMSKYALFLANWIQKQNFKNIYLYGHSMGGGIAAILNILIYNEVKGLIIEDGYNGYCSIINQEIFKMTKSLLKSIKNKKELDKTRDIKKNPYYFSFYDIYKPFHTYTWKFFFNLFDVDILLNVDDAYSLNLKKSLALYGIMDGIVNAQEAQKFFGYLHKNWQFEYIKDATHSSHEDNLNELKQKVCQYLTKITNIEYIHDYDLETIQTSINIGSPYVKQSEGVLKKFRNFFEKMTKK